MQCRRWGVPPGGDADQHRALPGRHPAWRSCRWPRSTSRSPAIWACLPTTAGWTPWLSGWPALPALGLSRPAPMADRCDQLGIEQIGTQHVGGTVHDRRLLAADHGRAQLAPVGRLVRRAHLCPERTARERRCSALAPHLIVAYPIAYAIGFVSFITPQRLWCARGRFYLLLAPTHGRRRGHGRCAGHADLDHAGRAGHGRASASQRSRCRTGHRIPRSVTVEDEHAMKPGDADVPTCLRWRRSLLIAFGAARLPVGCPEPLVRRRRHRACASDAGGC